MNKNIILITSSFPYGRGEQFLETEIKYYKDENLIILPITIYDSQREVLDNIKVDTTFADEFSKKNKYICLLKSLKHSFVYKEPIRHKPWSLKKIKILFSSLYSYQASYEILDSYFSKIADIDKYTLYTYWHTETTYALQTLKKKYNYKLVSRIHGGDLYQERKIFNYMPLKSQFIEEIDKIYTITKSANEYLVKTYGFDMEKIEVSRLGVEDKKMITAPTHKDSLHIVSCSFVSEVKRVDKIVYAIERLSTQIENLEIQWTHIGDGAFYDEIKKLAKDKLDKIDNVKYNFVGYLNNEKVYEFYKNNFVDVFLNVSESEGVPVSIMEAMSCHIPVIAPDVGGIADMIDDGQSGYLLSEKCSIDEIVDRLKEIEFYKNSKVRESTYKLFLEKYNARKNYSDFVGRLKSI